MIVLNGMHSIVEGVQEYGKYLVSRAAELWLQRYTMATSLSLITAAREYRDTLSAFQSDTMSTASFPVSDSLNPKVEKTYHRAVTAVLA